MLYLFSGDDTKKKILSYEKFLKALPMGAETFFINRNDFDRNKIESLYSGTSLFSPICTVVLENTFEREEMADFILDKLPLMGESTNTFIVLESKLGKPVLDAFKKSRAEINLFELPKEKKEKFDNFLVANAFANKDKLNTWIYFRQATDRGVAIDELSGVLFWKIKDMILKKNFSKYSIDQLKAFASHMSYLLPEARTTGVDVEAAFEQFLLEAF